MKKYSVTGILTLIVLITVIYFYNRHTGNDIINRFKAGKFSKNLFSRGLLYRYYEPVVEPGKKYPLVLYLHGGAERGSDNKSQLNSAATIWSGDAVQKNNPAYVIIPQCPRGHKWVNTKENHPPYLFFSQDSIPESTEMKMVMLLIHDFTKKYPIDTNRIYVAGFSMGSSGVWDMITRYPEFFAAAITVSGANDTTKAGKIVHLPIKIFHGAKDETCPLYLSEKMHDALHRMGSTCELTIFQDLGHVCVDQAFQSSGLFDWLFAQNKIKNSQQSR
jgi:predicted peptidase